VRRKDNRLLAGSLAVIASGPGKERRVLVPPAAGMAFVRQELLWLGRMTPTQAIDLLLRRTWITGEVDYVLVLGNSMGFAYLDEDRPFMAFSSGADDSESFVRHTAQSRQPPNGSFGVASFSVSAEAWNIAFQKLADSGLPGTLVDRVLTLDAEPLRFTVEYLPRWSAEHGVRTSTTEDYSREGPLLIKVHFRGRTQVLLQTGSLEDGAFRLQVGHINGEAAIQVSLSPRYNNSFVYYWVWSQIDGRFLRLLKSHSQGC
jgi:hypothetical protein